MLVGVPPRVGRSTRGTNGGAKSVGQLLDELEALLFAQPTTTGDDDGRLRHLSTAATFLLDGVDDWRTRGLVVQRLLEIGDLGGAVAALLGDEGVGLDGDELWPLTFGEALRGHLAAEDRLCDEHLLAVKLE